ncbi:PRK06851 family protein [Clostridium massiliodielmoense]|uniref:PRK06851 family protein n=1 Tax=Clostridium massiliodielmoense TaxID=1776385 RepID=UPI000A267852|nr:PRK06851 family protein [Clostridium massiliodielmoense]
MKGEFKHFFPGANTSRGFYSLFDYILPKETATRIFCIKGGPGTGKSYLMKKVGQYFNEKGYNIEYHHCSSDSDSLDAIVIKKLKIALLDGTAPHIVDPQYPGAIDEVLNMGDCWRESGFSSYRSAIISISKDIKDTFTRAYKYFAAAKNIHDDWSFYNSDVLDLSKLNLVKEKLKTQILDGLEVSSLGYDRHLFATSFTPKGIITYIDTLIDNYKRIYVLNGGPGTFKTNILDYLYKESLKRGLNVEVYHDPLIPERIEHILIPSLSIAIVTSNEINQKKFVGNQIYMEELCDSSLLKKYSSNINQSKENFYSLLHQGLDILASEKPLHDKLEECYTPNMNFEKNEAKFNEVINKILKYEKEYRSKL